MVMPRNLGAGRAMESDADFRSLGKVKRFAGYEHSSNESRSNAAGRREFWIMGPRRLFFFAWRYTRGGHDRARIESHVGQGIGVAILFASNVLDNEVGKLASKPAGA